MMKIETLIEFIGMFGNFRTVEHLAEELTELHHAVSAFIVKDIANKKTRSARFDVLCEIADVIYCSPSATQNEPELVRSVAARLLMIINDVFPNVTNVEFFDAITGVWVAKRVSHGLGKVADDGQGRNS